MSDFFRDQNNSDKVAENVDNNLTKYLIERSVILDNVIQSAEISAALRATTNLVRGASIVEGAAVGGFIGGGLVLGSFLLKDTYDKVHAERLAREAAEGNNEKHLGVLPSQTFPNRIEPPLNNEKTRH